MTRKSLFHFHIYSILKFGSLFALGSLLSCKTTVMGPTSESASAISFSGVQSIDEIRSTSAKVHWESHSSAQFYLIDEASSADGTILATILAPASQGTVSDLSPGTSYKLRVRLLDSSGNIDTNTVVQTFTTLTAAEDAAQYPALSVSPSSPTIAVGNSVAFSATGGTAPYTYVLISGTGTINGSSGLYTAPSSPGTATVRVIDSANSSVDATVTIQNALVISPSTKVLSINNSVEITASGGVAPLSFSITSGSSLGSLGACTLPNFACIKFTTVSSLGSANSGTAVVRVLDAVGNSGQTTITINKALALGPTSANVGINQSYSYFASYGAPPYTYSLVGAGSISSTTGIYTAPGSIGGPYTVRVTDSQNNTTTSTVTVVGASIFSGIDTIDQVSATSVNLNWTTSGTAASYVIYRIDSGTVNYVGTQAAPATRYTITGLSPLTTYTFRVRAVTSGGTSDTNTRDVLITTPGVSITHNGWTNLKSLGAITPVSQATGLSSAPATTILTWNAMTPNEESISSYNIYRSTTSNGQDFTVPLSTGISATTRSFTDTSVSSGTTYYYVVQSIVNGIEIAANPGNHPREIKVIVPPANMVLVHRWIANQEMCDLLQSPTDPTNNYRCAYTGLGGNGTHFDLGKSLFIDRVEIGCNYTPPNVTPALSCGNSTHGCIGTASPNGTVTGNQGDVFFDRTGGVCYINTNSSPSTGTTWTAANAVSLTAAQRAILASNQPGLPPLYRIDQNRSWDTCQAFTDPTYGAKRLLTHKEQIIAAAWDPNLSDTAINTLENGASLPSTGNCNTSNASGLTFDNNTLPADLETLGGTLASNVKAVRTGSTSTANCQSRYGVRDLVGNNWEFASDQLGNCSSTTNICTGTTSWLDPNNTDLNGFSFDGNQGPGGGGVTVTNWAFSAMSFNATQYIVPLGIPLVTSASASYGGLAIGAGAGQFDPAKFHADSFSLLTASGNGMRATITGGAYNSGTGGGRFTTYFGWLPATTGGGGPRCTFSAE